MNPQTRPYGTAALWGELTSTAALARGGWGAVCDGYTRDAALEKSSGESLFRTAVGQGMSPSEAFERYQVL